MLADGKIAAVASYGRQDEPGRWCSLLDLATGKVVSRIDIGEGSRPHGLKALADGRLLVTAEGKRELVVVDPQSGEGHRAHPDGPRHLAHGDRLARRPARVRHVALGRLGHGHRPRHRQSRQGHPDRQGRRGPRRDARRPRGLGGQPRGEHDHRDRRQDAALRSSRSRPPSFRSASRSRPTAAARWRRSRAPATCGVYDTATRVETARIAIGREAVAGAETRVFQKRFGTSPAPVGLLIAPDGKRAFVSAAACGRRRRDRPAEACGWTTPGPPGRSPTASPAHRSEAARAASSQADFRPSTAPDDAARQTVLAARSTVRPPPVVAGREGFRVFAFRTILRPASTRWTSCEAPRSPA